MNEFIFDSLPFEGEWLVFWGGDEASQNQHHGNAAQNFAFDFVKAEYEQSFGQDVLAAADGEVVEAVDGIHDNEPTETNDYMFLGNYVVIKHGDVYTITAHLKQDSVCVKRGEKVAAGQKIGLCGNSGNSSGPHIHFHAQDALSFTQLGRGYVKRPVARAVKVSFRHLKVNGETVKNYSPVKGDKVSNI